MRNLLALLAFVVVLFFGVGYFLGWYKIGTTAGPDGHRSVTIDLNTKKIGADLQTAGQKIQNALDKKETAAEVKAQPPQPAPPTGRDPMPWWSPTAQPWEPGYTQEPSPFAPARGVGSARQPEDVPFGPIRNR